MKGQRTILVEICLGNDIVDLTVARNPHPRFADRICSPRERVLIDAAPSIPMIWILWAAKEAAYKVFRKRTPNLAFSPATLAVEFVTGGHMLAATVAHKNLSCALSVHLSADYVHCIASTFPQPERAPVAFAVHSLPVSCPCSHECESLRVRALANRLLRGAGIDEVVVHADRRPPVLMKNNQPFRDCDVSLSHDGRFAAAVIGPVPDSWEVNDA